MLRIQGHWELPLSELSGLARRHDDATGAQLIAISDRGQVAIAELSATGGVSHPTAWSVLASDASGADFEGVASDGTSVFVLQEEDACVLVFDAALHMPAAKIIRLSIKADTARKTLGPGARWFKHNNSRGEGLLLLRDGHILIAKQRDPVCLIEFGPTGHAAGGFSRDIALPHDTSFVVGDTPVILDVLASWVVDPASGVESINDLAIDDAGRLYMVSSESRCLARLDSPMRPHDKSVGVTAWPLPAELFQSEEDRAEGLAFTPELGWLVALDLQRVDTNLFQLIGVPRAGSPQLPPPASWPVTGRRWLAWP